MKVKKTSTPNSHNLVLLSASSTTTTTLGSFIIITEGKREEEKIIYLLFPFLNAEAIKNKMFSNRKKKKIRKTTLNCVFRERERERGWEENEPAERKITWHAPKFSFIQEIFCLLLSSCAFTTKICIAVCEHDILCSQKFSHFSLSQLWEIDSDGMKTPRFRKFSKFFTQQILNPLVNTRSIIFWIMFF